MTMLRTTAMRSRPRSDHAMAIGSGVTTDRSIHRARPNRSMSNWICSDVGSGMRYERSHAIRPNSIIMLQAAHGSVHG